jgi:hypothetical protein
LDAAPSAYAGSTNALLTLSSWLGSPTRQAFKHFRIVQLKWVSTHLNYLHTVRNSAETSDFGSS